MVSTYQRGESACRRRDGCRRKKKSISSLTSHMIEEPLLLANNAPALAMCRQESMDIRNLVQAKMSLTLMELMGQLETSLKGKKVLILAWRRK